MSDLQIKVTCRINDLTRTFNKVLENEPERLKEYADHCRHDTYQGLKDYGLDSDTREVLAVLMVDKALSNAKSAHLNADQLS